MQSETFLDTAASVAAVAAVVGLLYARASAHAAREAADTARRSMELAERSRQAAARARLRLRVERVGEIVQDIATSSPADPGTEELSPATKAQCRVLHRAVIGLKDILPRSADLCRARSATDLDDRVTGASAEIDGLAQEAHEAPPPQRLPAEASGALEPVDGSPVRRGGDRPWAHPGQTSAVAVTTRVTSTATSRRCDPPPPSTDPRSGDTSQ